VNGNLKKTFFSVLAIYSAIIFIFTTVFYLIGFQDIIKTGSFMIDTITGGFQPPPQQFQQYFALAPKILLTLLMFLGSVNFVFNYRLFTLKLRKLLSPEVVLYLGILGLSTLLVFLFGGIHPIDSLFHVVSMSSSTGFDYINIPAQNSTVLSIFIVLMIVGGCTFSMAGGIRVSRLIAFGKSVGRSIKEIFAREKVIDEPIMKAEANNLENSTATVSIVLLIFTLVIFAVIFTTIGVSFTDALFEVGSALTTNGISMGATTATMPIGYKWLMIAAMTIGRVEILSVLMALVPVRLKE
jgi:trk system potassium uptake protein TrkH